MAKAVLSEMVAANELFGENPSLGRSATSAALSADAEIESFTLE